MSDMVLYVLWWLWQWPVVVVVRERWREKVERVIKLMKNEYYIEINF